MKTTVKIIVALILSDFINIMPKLIGTDNKIGIIFLFSVPIIFCVALIVDGVWQYKKTKSSQSLFVSIMITLWLAFHMYIEYSLYNNLSIAGFLK